MGNKPQPVTIGKRYNNTLTRDEGTYAVSMARPRIEALQREGVYPETLADIEHRLAALDPLDKAQKRTQQLYEKLTDRLNAELDRSVEVITTVHNLADTALGERNPEALESLPGRSAPRIVKNQSASLLECAAFVREYTEAFAVARAPATLADDLEALEQALTTTDAAQEKARVDAEAASRALFVCRGELYLLCKRVYRAGRNVFRKEIELRKKFAFQHMVAESSGAGASKTGAADPDGTKGGEVKAGEATGRRSSGRKARGGAAAPKKGAPSSPGSGGEASSPASAATPSSPAPGATPSSPAPGAGPSSPPATPS